MSPLYRRPHSARPMRVARFVATRVSDPERGPQVRINAEEAQKRMLVDGELVIIEGPRRQQLATLSIDDTLPRGDVAVRDVAGVAPSEIVYIIKPDLDAPPEFGRLA
ncbi:MAG: molybdopterin dinucleotide binding domain-containing protein [Gemmatirosa sp.]